MYFHWQNLNEKPGDQYGSGLLHGRAWWHVGAGVFHTEWSFGRFARFCHIGLTIGGEEEFGFHFKCGLPFLFNIYLTVADFRLIRWLANLFLPRTEERYGGTHGYRDEREISFSIHDWSLWWTIWRHPMGGWSREVSRFREGVFHPLDLLLGKVEYSERELHVYEEVHVPMPERTYVGSARIFEQTWKRPRWFTRRILRGELELKNDPIPFPGKGENSWDCGEDGMYGFSCQAKSLTELVDAAMESVLRTRCKRGRDIWNKPASGVQDYSGFAT